MLKKLLILFFILCFLALVAGGVFLTWGYFYITRDLPQLSTIEDYKPAAVSSIYARDGALIGEYFGDERRYPAKIKDIPPVIKNAFLAAEDASFYSHPGIDIFSILRAFAANLREGHAKQGGSTITQQVVKNMLLTPEKKITRKLKEAILSYQLEKRFSKDEILEIYLNQIFFGNFAYGIKAAVRFYYHKDLADVTLAEAAILAGLPKAPSKFSPILNPDRARRRQRYVIGQMVKHRFATTEEAETALKEKVQVYPASTRNIFAAPCYVSEVRRILQEKFRDLDPDSDGLQIYTTVDLKAEKMAETALRKGLGEVDKRRGWRGPIGQLNPPSRENFLSRYPASKEGSAEPGENYPAVITRLLPGGVAEVDLGFMTGSIRYTEAGWAKKILDKDEHVSFSTTDRLLKTGDIVEVSFVERDVPQPKKQKGDKSPQPAPQKEKVLVLDQTPEIEGAIVLINPFSGEVLAMVGGYSYQRSQFNRVTQSYRQPGSAFKPLVYLSAVDAFNYTPATIVYDAPRSFRVGDQVWEPANFDETFLGPITLRVALEKSRNLVSADIVSRIGVDPIIRYAKKLGIESKIGQNLSIALGSSEVTPLELTRAYGVFAARGILVDSTFITKIIDRNGKVVFDYEKDRQDHARQVISEQSAFIMANMMKGVVESGTGYKVKEIGRPVAGKTGTSNEEMDTWFIGYTPHWVAGVWSGFDLKKRIGEKETGGRIAAPIWLYFMKEYLKAQDEESYGKLVEEAKAEADRLGISYVPPEPIEQLDFSVPEGVDPYWISKETGLLANEGEDGAFLEYFVRGTEPQKSSGQEETSTSYLETPGL